MRTFRIRTTVAAIAAAIPFSIGFSAHAEDQRTTSQSSASTSQPSEYTARSSATTTQPSAQHEQAQMGQQAQGQYGQAVAQGGHELVGKDLHGARGEQVGEISNVLVKDGNAAAVVVDVGGFLGIGQKAVAIPLDNLQVTEDRVIATNLTEESAKNLPEYDERNPGDYSPLVSRDGPSAWERESARDRPTTGANQPATSQSSAASLQPSAYTTQPSSTTQPSAQREQSQAGPQQAQGQYGQAMAQDGRELVGKDLYGAQGEQVGEISNVLVKDGNASAVVVDVGGFLGIGEKAVAIPLDNLQVGEDRVTATNLTEESAKNLPEYDERNPGDYSPLVSRDGQSAWERDGSRDGTATGANQPAANTSAARTSPN